MSEIVQGSSVIVDVLGAGRQAARVEAFEPMSFHGVPGFARRVRLRLADGSCLDGISLPSGAPIFTSPRVRWIST